jgi:hypothetical protein
MDGFYSTLTVSSFINASSISTGYLFADATDINSLNISSLSSVYLNAAIATFGKNIDITGPVPEFRFGHSFIGDVNTIQTMRVSTFNNGEYKKETLVAAVAYDTTIRSLSNVTYATEYFQPSTGLAFIIGSNLGTGNPDNYTLQISSQQIFVRNNLYTSSLTVSSINGQQPGVSSDLTLSTLLVSSSVIAKEQLQVSTPSTLLRMYTNLDTNAFLELTPQTHTAFFNVNTINSSFTIQHGIDGTPTGIIKFGPSTLTISSTEVVIPTNLTASTVSSGNAFVGDSLYATKGKFGPQIDVLGIAENRYPHIFEGFPNTDYIAKVSTTNSGQYSKLTTLNTDAYDASLRFLGGIATGMEYFQPSTGFSFRVGSELFDVNEHSLQISSQQVFVRSELFTSSLIVSSINGQIPGTGSVGCNLQLSTLAVSSVSSIFINTDVLNANTLNVSSIPGSNIQAFSLPWSKMQQTGNLTVYGGTWTHGGTLSISNLSVSSSYTVNDLQANTMTVRTNAVICTIIAPAISTIWISAASAYIQGIDFYNASGNSLTVSNLTAGTLGFTNLNARNVIASTATLSSLFTNTHITSSLFASQGISTNTIFASSISTYSMSVYGPNTLTVTGNAFFTKEIIMSSLVVTGGLQISTTGTNTFDTTNATISSLTVSSINGSAYNPGGGGGVVTDRFSTLFTSSLSLSTVTFLDASNVANSASLSNYNSNLYFNTYQMINTVNLTSTVESLLGMISTLSTALAIATLNIQNV